MLTWCWSVCRWPPSSCTSAIANVVPIEIWIPLHVYLDRISIVSSFWLYHRDRYLRYWSRTILIKTNHQNSTSLINFSLFYFYTNMILSHSECEIFHDCYLFFWSFKLNRTLSHPVWHFSRLWFILLKLRIELDVFTLRVWYFP